MESRFRPAFEYQARQLIGHEPFRSILPVITDVENEVSHKLRADGLVFLLINIAYMIILPWERAEMRSFAAARGDLLKTDIKKILEEADTREKEEMISANTLLEVVNSIKPDLRILGLQIWG